MNITIVGSTNLPIKVKVNEWLRGYSAFAGMYPEHTTYDIAADNWSPVFNDVSDLLFFIPNSIKESTKKMLQIVEEFKGITICYNCDPANAVVGWHPLLTQKTIELFNMCDAVATHGKNDIEIISFLTKSPVYFLGEPSYIASNKEKFLSKKQDRKIILCAITQCSGYNTRKNALFNYAVMKNIQDRFGNKFEYKIIANKTEADAGGMYGTEKDLLDIIGADFILKNINGRPEMFDLLKETALFINLDSTGGMGHFNIEAAALKVPTIASKHTAGSVVFSNVFNSEEIGKITSYAVKVLNREVDTEIETAYKNADLFTFSSVRKRLEEIINDIRKDKATH